MWAPKTNFSNRRLRVPQMRNQTPWRASLALALSAASLAFAPTTGLAKDYVVHAGRLFDGLDKTIHKEMTLRIHDDRIVAVEPGYQPAPAGVEVIDLTQDLVAPGLIDCHVHIAESFHAGDAIRGLVTRTPFDKEIDGVNNLKASLLAGFTTVRDVGDPTGVVVALKRAVAHGDIPGPRLWVAGEPLSPTGGHGDDANGINPEITNPAWASNLIDSPDAARRAVRRLRREGADLIKILPSGGVMSIGDDPNLQLMTDDEIKAVVETAHALNMKVAAHAHGEIAINHALQLGVDSIEHGSFADAASYAIFKAKGAYLVPTLLVGMRVYQHAKTHPEDLNPSTAEKALVIGPVLQKNLHDAYAAGVKIAFGTETFGMSAHGENAQEFALMVQAGMPPIEALWAATHNAADLIGAKDIGALAPGRFADLVAVKGDPTTEITVMEHPDFVMKGGAVVKSGGKSML